MYAQLTQSDRARLDFPGAFHWPLGIWEIIFNLFPPKLPHLGSIRTFYDFWKMSSVKLIHCPISCLTDWLFELMIG